MLGGGFIGQMHDTMNKNRQMVRDALRKSKHKPFENTGNFSSNNKTLTYAKTLTDAERERLIASVIANNKKEAKKKLAILVMSIVIIMIVYLAIGFILK